MDGLTRSRRLPQRREVPVRLPTVGFAISYDVTALVHVLEEAVDAGVLRR